MSEPRQIPDNQPAGQTGKSTPGVFLPLPYTNLYLRKRDLEREREATAQVEKDTAAAAEAEHEAAKRLTGKREEEPAQPTVEKVAERSQEGAHRKIFFPFELNGKRYYPDGETPSDK